LDDSNPAADRPPRRLSLNLASSRSFSLIFALLTWSFELSMVKWKKTDVQHFVKVLDSVRHGRGVRLALTEPVRGATPIFTVGAPTMNQSSEREQVEMSQAQPQTAAAAKNTGGRDDKGRFIPGNPGGPGNPFARKTAAFRTAFVNAVTQKDFEEVTRAVIERAKKGDMTAAKLFYSYTMGTSDKPKDPDTLDQKELAVFAGNHVAHEEFEKIATHIPVGPLVAVLRVLIPYLNAGKAMQLEQIFDKAGKQVDRRERERQEEEDEAFNDEIEKMLGVDELVRAAKASAPPAATSAAVPDRAADPAAGQKDIEETLAKWDRETEELKEKLGMKPAAENPQTPATPVNRLDDLLDAGQTISAPPPAARKKGRGMHHGPEPSVNGSDRGYGGGKG
jgi:hypothetical protein